MYQGGRWTSRKKGGEFKNDDEEEEGSKWFMKDCNRNVHPISSQNKFLLYIRQFMGLM